MSEDPQLVSISSSLAVTPDEIARKTFPVARRGVDAEAVRLYLTRVAAELREVSEREVLLRERLADAERRAADPVLDEATLTRAIGVETAKILSTAHEAARNVLANAEAQAAELTAAAESVLSTRVAEADAEALAIRTAAEQEAGDYLARAQAEADALTDEAHSDAVELLDATKEECRRMVAEARDLRNRTLADLVERRRVLRVQLEELRAGKDSLLGVVDGLTAAADDLRRRLLEAEDQARVAADEAGGRAELQADHEDLSTLEVELAGAGLEAGAPVEKVEDVPVSDASPGEAEGRVAGEAGATAAGTSASRRSVEELFARIRASRAAEEAAANAEPVAEALEAEAADSDTADAQAVAAVADAAAAAADAALVAEAMAAAQARAMAEAALEDGSHEEPRPEPPAADAAGGSQAAGTDLASEPAEVSAEPEQGLEGVAHGEGDVQAGTEAESEGEPGGEAREAAPAAPSNRRRRDLLTEPDVESLARRDHLLAPVSAKLGRALKRALQDDQNDLLNALRQSNRKPVLDELMPPRVQVERFVAAASDQLAKAFEAGAAFLVTGDRVEGPTVSAPPPSADDAAQAGAAIAAQLADDLSSMLRQRINEALSDLDGGAEGGSDAAGVAYREWKGTRVEGLAGDFTTRAFAAGELAVLEAAAGAGAMLVRWAVEDDDGGGSCPDCDDNSLAGPQVAGVAFPTGHAHPPVHPGCRCLLVPVPS